MAQKTRSALTTQANIIKNETTALANTATRVGTMHVDEIDSNFNLLTDNITTIDGLKRNGSNANSDIDIGAYSLNARHVKINGTAGDGHLGLKHQSGAITAGGGESSLGADASGNPIWKNDGNALRSIQLDNSANTATNYTTPLDADKISIWDVANSVLKSVTWANLKSTLKTYFDTIYSSNQALVYTDNTGYTPASGAETVVFSVLIPANTFSKGKLVELDLFLFKDLATPASYTFNAYISTTNYAQGTTAGLPAATQRIITQSSGSIAQVTCHVRRHLYIHPTTGLITMTNQGTSGSVTFTDFGTVSSPCSTAMTFDNTVNNYVVITQLSAHLSKLPLLSIK